MSSDVGEVMEKLEKKLYLSYVTSSSLNSPGELPMVFTLPQSRTYKPNSRGSDVCRGSNSLWARTLDRYTRAGLPECQVSTMAGPPPETTKDRTQTKDTHPLPGQKLKFLTPPGIEPGSLGWKAGTLTTMPQRRIRGKTNCNNYRRMSLSLTSYKILLNIILRRLTPYVDEIIGDHQCGNRSTIDQIFCIRQILEKK